MKKQLLSLALIGILSLCAFSSKATSSVSYSDISSPDGDPVKEISASQISSFDRFEQSVHTHDKGTFTKRYETWTLTDNTTAVDKLETVISRN